MLDALATREELRIIVGAGSSVGAGVPTWRQLVTDLLESGLRQLGRAEERTRKELRAQAEHMVGEYGPTVAAAMARVLWGDERDQQVRSILYAAKERPQFPSPIANAVSELAAVYRPQNTYVGTTNYDDLLERAVNDADRGLDFTAVPRTGKLESTLPRQSDDLPIHHLHGYIPSGTGAIEGDVILDEADFALSEGTPIDELMSRLREPGALFVGMSFTDTNVTTAGYRTSKALGNRGNHYALFVDRVSEGASRELQHLIGGRLASLGIQPIWLKSYAQPAQVLVELALRRSLGTQYWQDASDLRYGRRLIKWRDAILSEWPRDRDRFEDSQAQLSERLHDACKAIEERFITVLGEEHFGVDLWAREPDNVSLGRLEHWANSTRVHRAAWSLAPPQDVHEASTFPAVQAVFRGAPVVRGSAGGTSRWRYMVALPITLRQAPWYTLPVGSITLGSTADEESSVLRQPQFGAVVVEALNELHDLGAKLLSPSV